MRKTLKVFKYRCDICGAVQEVENYSWEFSDWLPNRHFPSWFRRNLHIGPDICNECRTIIRNAQESTNVDPLIDLVNRKQKIQGEQS